MNPFFFFGLGALTQKITCPNCKRQQYIGKIRSRRQFPCKYCGFMIEMKGTGK